MAPQPPQLRKNFGDRTANHSAVFVTQPFRAIDKLAVQKTHEVRTYTNFTSFRLSCGLRRSKKPRTGGNFRDRMCVCRTAHARSNKHLLVRATPRHPRHRASDTLKRQTRVSGTLGNRKSRESYSRQRQKHAQNTSERLKTKKTGKSLPVSENRVRTLLSAFCGCIFSASLSASYHHGHRNALNRILSA